MQIQIRNMTKADIAQVGGVLYGAFNSVAIKHGYAQKMNDIQEGKAWAWAIFRHGPREPLIAEVENRIVGICCLNPRGNLGGVGPVAVDPRFSRSWDRKTADECSYKKIRKLAESKTFSRSV